MIASIILLSIASKSNLFSIALSYIVKALVIKILYY